MSDDERIEQLELENKVLQKNNKGLKAKIDELQKEIEKLNIALMTATLKIEGLKIEAVYNDNYTSNDKIKAKIEEVDNDENASIPDFMEYAKEYAKKKLQSLLEKE